MRGLATVQRMVYNRIPVNGCILQNWGGLFCGRVICCGGVTGAICG